MDRSAGENGREMAYNADALFVSGRKIQVEQIDKFGVVTQPRIKIFSRIRLH